MASSSGSGSAGHNQEIAKEIAKEITERIDEAMKDAMDGLSKVGDKTTASFAEYSEKMLEASLTRAREQTERVEQLEKRLKRVEGMLLRFTEAQYKCWEELLSESEEGEDSSDDE